MAEGVLSQAAVLAPSGSPRFPRRWPAFELVQSKLLRPPVRDDAVGRGALVRFVEDAAAYPVVFVSAGPGWGKTTLLAQWAASSARPFAWVSADRGDNDPIVLLTYVAAALDRISPLESSVLAALAVPGTSVEATIVPRLGAALAAMGREFVLVIDDLHLVDDRQCLDAVAALARHVPEGSQLVLAARGRPALPLAAMRARGLSVEIGPDDLRMSPAEAQWLLNAAGVDLSDGQITQLIEHTEGWAAGLYLAALSIRGRRIKAEDDAVLVGSDQLISEYLQSELLANVPEDEVRFLTRTAVLERMSGPLCDAVLGERGSTAMLESLERSNLFLVALDRHRTWYRYHHLFRELLRSELERAEPELVPALLRRAVDWSVANGQPEAAIGYAQDAGDVDRVAWLAERCTQPVYQSGRVATTERWLEWLERHGALERNAAIAILGALVAAVQGRPAESDRWADAAEEAPYSGAPPDGSASIDSWLALLRALRCRRGVARMGTDAEHAMGSLSRASQFRPTAMMLLAVSRLLRGESAEADDLLADAAEEGVALGAPEPAMVALAERAVIAMEREAWSDAAALAESAVALMRDARMDEYPSSAFVAAVAARMALHRDGAVDGHEFLAMAQRLRLRLTWAVPWVAAQTRLELARCYLALADVGGARTMLRELDPILGRQPDLGRVPAEVEELRSSLKTLRVEVPGASTLTTAELRVLPLLATHLSFPEIGERMYLSRHTVKSHATSVYRKLNVTSRNDAVERARELGLL